MQVTAGKREQNALRTRKRLLDAALELGTWQHGEAAARCLVMPIIDCVEATEEGIQFVRVVSQVAAIHQNGAIERGGAGIRFPENRGLADVFQKALSGLSQREAQRRIYLVVTNTFHSIADSYRSVDLCSTCTAVASKKSMVGQLVLLLNAFFSAPPLDEARNEQVAGAARASGRG